MAGCNGIVFHFVPSFQSASVSDCHSPTASLNSPWACLTNDLHSSPPLATDSIEVPATSPVMVGSKIGGSSCRQPHHSMNSSVAEPALWRTELAWLGAPCLPPRRRLETNEWPHRRVSRASTVCRLEFWGAHQELTNEYGVKMTADERLSFQQDDWLAKRTSQEIARLRNTAWSNARSLAKVATSADPSALRPARPARCWWLARPGGTLPSSTPFRPPISIPSPWLSCMREYFERRHETDSAIDDSLSPLAEPNVPHPTDPCEIRRLPTLALHAAIVNRREIRQC